MNSRRMKWARKCSGHWVKRNAYRLLLVKPEGRKPLGISRCMWEDNIKMDLREIGSGRMKKIGLAQNRDRWRALVNSVMNHLLL
jgi:hypothetical protein